MIGIDTFVSKHASSDTWLNVHPLALLLVSRAVAVVPEVVDDEVERVAVAGEVDVRLEADAAVGLGVVVDDEALLPRVTGQGVLDADRQQTMAARQLLEEVERDRQACRHQLHHRSVMAAQLVVGHFDLLLEHRFDPVQGELCPGGTGRCLEAQFHE